MKSVKREGEERRSPVPMSMRISPEIRDRLISAAQESGRSLTQEIALRLEQSFAQQGIMAPALRLAFGPEPAGILLIVAREFNRRGRIGAVISAGGDPEAKAAWHQDPYAYDQAVRAAAAVMEAFRPVGDPSLPAKDQGTAERLDHLAGAGVAIALAAIKDPQWGNQFPPAARNRELERFADEARELLGDELVARIPAPEMPGPSQEETP